MLRIVDSASGHVVAEWHGEAVGRVLTSARLTATDLATAPGTTPPTRVLRSLLLEALGAEFMAPGTAHGGTAEVVPFPRCRAGQGRPEEHSPPT